MYYPRRLNEPVVAELTAEEKKYALYHLGRERLSFETGSVIAFLFWLILPAFELHQYSGAALRMQHYALTALSLLPVVLLVVGVIYYRTVYALETEIAHNAKTVIRTSVEKVIPNKHNSITIYTTYDQHRVFKLGKVIGHIKPDKPITISYFEGCDVIIDYEQ
ncbi:MAG: hypothetical protein INR69_07140 [Mucilaginibacter polytrichastri]|nr:hypothetical protein [Mucilaginibacter polytrichastri]